MNGDEEAHLLIQGGSNHGMTVPLSEVPLILGRGPDNDLDIDQDTVSRRHALILEGRRWLRPARLEFGQRYLR